MRDVRHEMRDARKEAKTDMQGAREADSHLASHISHLDAHAKRIIDVVADLRGAARGAHLEQECAGNVELRRRIESLLAAMEKDGPFLNNPTIDSAPVESAALTEKAGGRIGPYKLLELSGEGGFGSVFMAEQTEPIYRRWPRKVAQL